MVDQAKEKDKETKPKKTKKKGLGFMTRFLLMMIILVGAFFLPVTLVFIVGMLPTFAALLVDTTRDKTRSLTVGLMNFIGCIPFLIDVAMQTQTLDSAYEILTEPINIILMYSGAVAGYFLDWTMSGMSNVIMTTRAKHYIETMTKRQTELQRRWGAEVTGDVPLDRDGFPLHQNPS